MPKWEIISRSPVKFEICKGHGSKFYGTWMVSGAIDYVAGVSYFDIPANVRRTNGDDRRVYVPFATRGENDFNVHIDLNATPVTRSPVTGWP